MLIRILESVSSTHYNYGKGYEGEVPDEIAKDLLKAGHAEPIGRQSPTAKAETATSKPAAKSEKR